MTWINLLSNAVVEANLPPDANVKPAETFAEYLWLGGSGNALRSRTKVLALQRTADGQLPSPEACPTLLECSVDGDVLLRPRRVFADPFRKGSHILVLCDTFQPPQDLVLDADPAQLTPCAYNHRVPCQNLLASVAEDAPLFGVEQEYAVHVAKATSMPPQWLSACEPTAVTGSDERVHGGGFLKWDNNEGQRPQEQVTPAAVARELSDRHLQHCLSAGLKITGARQKPGGTQLQQTQPRPPTTALSNRSSVWGGEQRLASPTHSASINSTWSYKIGPCSGVDLGDQLWVSRYTLLRLAERCNVPITFDSPCPGDSSGCNTAVETTCITNPGLSCAVKYSTAASRVPGGAGLGALQHLIGRLEATHEQHALVYSRGIDDPLSPLPPFTSSLGGTTASVTIPTTAVLNAHGYLVDRRPAACMDPYIVTMFLVAATLQHGPVEGGDSITPAASAAAADISDFAATDAAAAAFGNSCVAPAAGSPGGQPQVLRCDLDSASSACSSHSPEDTWGSQDCAQSGGSCGGLAGAAAMHHGGSFQQWHIAALLSGGSALSAGALVDDDDEEDDALLSDVDDAALMMSDDEAMGEEGGNEGGWELQPAQHLSLAQPFVQQSQQFSQQQQRVASILAFKGGYLPKGSGAFAAPFGGCDAAVAVRLVADQFPASAWHANAALFGTSSGSGNSIDGSDNDDDEPDSEDLLLDALEEMDSASDASEMAAGNAMMAESSEDCQFDHQGGRQRGASLYQLACLAGLQQKCASAGGGNVIASGSNGGAMADGSGGESAFRGWGKMLQVPQQVEALPAAFGSIRNSSSGRSSGGSSPDDTVKHLLASMLSCAPRSW